MHSEITKKAINFCNQVDGFFLQLKSVHFVLRIIVSPVFDYLTERVGIGTANPLMRLTVQNGAFGIYAETGGSIYLGDNNFYSQYYAGLSPGLKSDISPGSSITVGRHRT